MEQIYLRQEKVDDKPTCQETLENLEKRLDNFDTLMVKLREDLNVLRSDLEMTKLNENLQHAANMSSDFHVRNLDNQPHSMVAVDMCLKQHQGMRKASCAIFVKQLSMFNIAFPISNFPKIKTTTILEILSYAAMI